MATQLPPMPNNPITDVFVWRDWFYKVSQLLVQQASIAWTSIDFTGSNLQDIQTRQHNALQSIQGGIGGQYYHLTQAEYNSIAALPTVPFNTSSGGTGVAGTLTGYVYGHGTSPMTASTTIPWTDISGVPSFTAPSYGSFHQDGTTTLTSAITNVSTTPIPVVSTAGFPSSGYLLIGSELISYTATTSTTFAGTITRGVLGTTNIAHSSGDYATEAQATGSSTAIGTMRITSTDISNNISINPSDITQMIFSKAGTYNIQFSAQLINYTTTDDNVTFWYRKNGTDVPYSAGVQQVVPKHGSSPGATIVAWNYFDTVNAGDYIQLCFSSDTGNTAVATTPPGTSPVHPTSPALIITANQIG